MGRRLDGWHRGFIQQAELTSSGASMVASPGWGQRHYSVQWRLALHCSEEANRSDSRNALSLQTSYIIQLGLSLCHSNKW